MNNMIRLSQVWLFGTESMKRNMSYDDAIEECRHTHPDGHYTDEYIMNEDEAEELLETGFFPDSVWDRLTKHS